MENFSHYILGAGKGGLSYEKVGDA